MNNLPIPSFFDHRHDNIFRRHEWQLLRYPTSDDFGINNKSLGDVLYVERTISAVRNASGRVIRRFALQWFLNHTFHGRLKNIYLSSSVLSNHCTLLVIRVFWWRTMRCLAKLQTRSDRMGFLLYAIAEDPIWVDSNGSSISWERRH